MLYTVLLLSSAESDSDDDATYIFVCLRQKEQTDLSNIMYLRKFEMIRCNAYSVTF